MTDSLNPYPENNYSYFDIKIGIFNNDDFSYNNFIEFHHKYDTDSLLDGCYITVSTDSGKTWMNIINKQQAFGAIWMDQYATNLYSEQDTLFNGEYGFSGHSDEWLTTAFGWGLFVVKSEWSTQTQ